MHVHSVTDSVVKSNETNDLIGWEANRWSPHPPKHIPYSTSPALFSLCAVASVCASQNLHLYTDHYAYDLINSTYFYIYNLKRHQALSHMYVHLWNDIFEKSSSSTVLVMLEDSWWHLMTRLLRCGFELLLFDLFTCKVRAKTELLHRNGKRELSSAGEESPLWSMSHLFTSETCMQVFLSAVSSLIPELKELLVAGSCTTGWFMLNMFKHQCC